MLKTAELQITAVTPADIPESVEEYFRASSAVLTMDGETSLRQFDHLLRIDGMGATTYLGEHEKLYATGELERVSYLVDMTEDGTQNIGNGELRFDDSSNTDYFKDKPFVGYTRTHDTYLEQGYGRRRLHALNLAAQTLYDLPLHSDTLRKTPATRLWEKLVADSLAEMYMQGQHTRYKFIR